MGIEQQIKCLKKEIDRRKKKYPLLVENGVLTAEQASYEIATMLAATETLAQIRGIANLP